MACHNGLKTSSGEDISIGFDWSASIMANSVPRSLLAGKRAERVDRSSRVEAGDRRRVFDLPLCRPCVWRTGLREDTRSSFRAFRCRSFHMGPRGSRTRSPVRFAIRLTVRGWGRATFVGNVVFAKPVQNDERPEYADPSKSTRAPDRDALLDRDILPDQGRPYPRSGSMRELPYALHRGAWVEG